MSDSDPSSSAGVAARPAPPETWRCFQCDEVFTDRAEAREHFGDYPDDSPLCLIKGQDGGLGARIRELEAEVSAAYNERNEYENDARLWHEAEADRRRRIGDCQWWQELDSRDGERLVLQERIAELEAALARPAWQPALQLLRQRLDYYEVMHDAQCGCWTNGHHENLKYCTCPVGIAMNTLAAALPPPPTENL